jgi:hypothetical protein
MSTVQEIEAALAALSRDDLEMVERRIAELKRSQGEASEADYARQEYGLSNEELERFEERMTQSNQSAFERGETTAFPGKFDPACLD